MGAYSSTGTRYTTGTFPKTAYTPSDAEFTLSADVYTDRVMAGEEGNFKNPAGQDPTGRVLWRKSGARCTASEIAAMFGAATLTAVTPATGAAAGGTAVTLTGTNLTGATAGTIGGVALTTFVVVNSRTITAVTGAHAAGAVSTAVVDDSGTTTQAGLFTYV